MSQPRGRLTRAQRRALAELLPWYIANGATVSEIRKTLPDDQPLAVEIGFGMGEALFAWAQAHADWHIIGVEIYPPGIGALVNKLAAAEIENVSIVQARAESLFNIDEACAGLTEVRALFPDPWPKKRHTKRRLLQPSFLTSVSHHLIDGGRLRVATDWQPYAEWALEQLEASSELTNEYEQFAPTNADRVETKFERRGLGLGHAVFELSFRRVQSKKRCSTPSR